MKLKSIHQLLIAFLVFLGLQSCDNRDTMTIDKGNTPEISSLSSTKIVLDSDKQDSIALTVKWKPATYTVPTEIKYKIEISDNESFSDFLELGSTDASITEASYTTSQLNTFAKELGFETSEESTMYIRVKALLGASSLVQISPVKSLTIVPYELGYPDFYIVGEASFVGWNANQAQLFHKEGSLSYMYTYLEKDKSFRFLGQKDWGPINYSIDAPEIKEDNRYFLSTGDNIGLAAGDNENMKFLGESGIYKVIIDANKTEKSIKAVVASTKGYDYPNLYIVGNIAGNNWTAEQAIAMERKSAGVFELILNLPDGAEFKFLGQQSWGDLDWGNISGNGNSGYLAPKGDNGNITYNGGGSSYKLTVNLKAGTYNITAQ